MTGHGEVPSHPKGAGTEVRCTVVPEIIAIAVQLPETCTRVEDADLCCPCARPVPDDGAVSLLAKGSQTAVYLAAVPDAVAIEIQVPLASARAEEPNLYPL